jgi:hypothetical protein
MRFNFSFQLLCCLEVLFSPIICNAQSINKSQELNWMMEFSEPIPLAKEFIARTKIFWEPLGKTMVDLTYKVGFTTARMGGRYLLLESPSLAIEMVNKGAYSTISHVAYDEILEIIKVAVKSPDKLCVNIAQSTINEGLKDYHKAYNIAKQYLQTGELTEKNAIIFLTNRWNFLKLGIARKLYLECEQEYDIEKQIAEKSTMILLNHFESVYKAKLDVQRDLPLLDAAFFINDMIKIIKASGVGLGDYPPYLDYIEDITTLNSLKLKELQRLAYGFSVFTYDSLFTFIPGKCVGPITGITNIFELKKIFGESSISNETVQIAEGIGARPDTVTKINKGTLNELTVFWKHGNTFDKPEAIGISSLGTRYHSDKGLTIGTTLEELNSMNGRPIEILVYGGGGEVLGVVSRWMSGNLTIKDYYLQSYLNDGLNGNVVRTKQNEYVLSNSEWLKKHKVTVRSLLISLDESYAKNELPQAILDYLKNVTVSCYDLSQNFPEIIRLDLNNDNTPEFIVWFNGCPDTHGRGTILIFDGSNPEFILAQYFGYEVENTHDIRVLDTDHNKQYKDIIIGKSGNSIILQFDIVKNKYTYR